MSKTNTVYSYVEFMNDRNHFRKVDYKGLNRYDTPSALFFKLVFYFSDESGLLALDSLDLTSKNRREQSISNIKAPYTNPDSDKKAGKRPYEALGNTALNYLLLNDELERAELLKQFIILLSSINADSPWYFKEVTGLDAALERKVFTEAEFKIEDKPRQITIKCLNDAQDDRIGTLLDLYRSICYSYQMKREVVPANLRKFNMAILIFGAPIRGKGGKSGDKNNRIQIPDSANMSVYFPSLKMVEFRNCEFDYNSSKSAWGTLNAEEPLSPEYTIGINYDDAYEVRYNDVMQKVVTDFITIDIASQRNGSDSNLTDINRFGKRVYNDTGDLKIKFGDKNYWLGGDDLDDVLAFADIDTGPYAKNVIDDATGLNGLGEGLVSQGVGAAETVARDVISRLYLGNIYNFSMQNAIDKTKQVMSGDIVGVAATITRENIGGNNIKVGDKGALYGYKDEKEVKQSAEGELYKTPERKKSIGGEINDKPGIDDRLAKKDKLPQYNIERTSFIGKYNEGKSIYNSL